MPQILITVSQDIQLKSWDLKYSSELFDLTDKNRDYLLPWLAWVPKVKQISDSEQFISSSIEEMESDKSFELGIWYQNKLVGCLGLHGLSRSNRRASIGYWLDQDFQGKGIVSQSVKSLIDYSFTTLDLNRLELLAATENLKSFSIAEKLGFSKEGIVRQSEYINGKFLDHFQYSILKSDWKK